MQFLKEISFSENDVHVFIVDLNALEIHLPKFITYLSNEEKVKAAQFRFDHLRKHCIISHGLLRGFIGTFLSVSPQNVKYRYNEFQKPLSQQSPSLYFNMSHSRNQACFAFSFDHQIGVDIEFIDNTVSVEELLPSITAPDEVGIFDTLKNNDRIYSFYKIWTLKEAFLKALGLGLSFPLSRIETSVLPKEKFSVTKFNEIVEISKGWTFSPIELIPQYLGAIAVERKNAKILFHYLNEETNQLNVYDMLDCLL